MSRGRIFRSHQRGPRGQRRSRRFGPQALRAHPAPPSLVRGPRRKDTRFKNGFRNLGLAAQFLIAVGIGLLILTVAGVGAAAAAGVAGWSYVTTDLPNINTIEAPQFETTKIYDRNWVLLAQIADPNTGYRTNVTYEEIQDHISQQQNDPAKPHRAWIFDASVAAEDASFWSNPGFDPYAILRSAFIEAGGGTTGASTITQQLVRGLYPDTIGNQRSITRKIREAIVAYEFSKQYKKTEVMQMYLNTIYYGHLSYGIDAASQTYFNKHPWDLTLGEAAMLAGLPQAPSLYDPIQNYELARARQKYVLDRMVKQGMITAEQADDAYAQPLNPQPPDRSEKVPQFVDYVKYYLEQKYGADAVYRGGLTVRTTLDVNLQNSAQQIVAQHIKELAPYDANNGAAVVMLPETGEILAMVGSADYYNAAIDGQVNVAVRERQPGSSIKPITYLAAFEKGWNPGTVIFDYDKKWLNPGAPDPFYQPKNYTRQNYGAVSVREALDNSLNIPAVQALDYVGVANMIDLAHRMGIKTGLWRGDSFYGLSVTLGGGEVTLLEHTNAFSTLANMGRYVPYTPVMSISDGSGKTLYSLDRERALQNGEQVVKPEHAYQIADILTDDKARAMVFGTGTKLTLPELQNRPVAAKTGTTDHNEDTWTMGYTTDVAVGVWVGNTDNHPTRNLDGIQSAAPIWHDIMVKIHQDPNFQQDLLAPNGQPVSPVFPVPAGITHSPVCNATGNLPIPGAATHDETLVLGEGPTLKCNQISDATKKDLEAALADAAKNPSFTSRGLQTLRDYAAMVNVGSSSLPGGTRTPTKTTTNNTGSGSNSSNSNSIFGGNSSNPSNGGRSGVPTQPAALPTQPDPTKPRPTATSKP